MIKDKPVQTFLDELASKSSTPGGGSAAAVMGAMGAALVSMVCNLTIGKKGYEAVDADMRALLQRTEALRAKLADMVRADVEVFDKVMAAYGLPKDSDEQKAARSAAIQAALKQATDVPMECARACAEAIALSRIAAEQGNRNVVTDAGVAVMAAYAALKSAALNVYINTGTIRDKDFVEQRVAELEAILTVNEDATAEIYALVKSKL
ncbi:methenyltetrahydrofolate cyclohydrolase [Methylogaea oryzae]|uniref:Sugar ABC transporter substrate-binding protein n=1 Tax=Methylogaea oryzae TaxID=1295382 RepID=A0A8D4VQS6_9GAMM|nr:methenyltetrahydrofolate cyclohydrolase [Methylogaea oryzae]BBL72007.1 sugar ABC transporter substrate-binding protein [Methylogaea oryzae]